MTAARPAAARPHRRSAAGAVALTLAAATLVVLGLLALSIGRDRWEGAAAVALALLGTPFATALPSRLPHPAG
jgi:hypothetical protein